MVNKTVCLTFIKKQLFLLCLSLWYEILFSTLAHNYVINKRIGRVCTVDA